MPLSTNGFPPTIGRALIDYWKTEAERVGPLSASGSLLLKVWEFVRDSTPWRLRQRYGDADYDWDHRVNTTSAAVGWRDRLLGVFNSPYQPTDPTSFRQMIEDLRQHTNLDLADFTFLDLGSGKGRTLLMAADYPFQRIVGVELLPSLHEMARENLARYRNESQQCYALESVCADGPAFSLPLTALVIYLFNPFPEPGLRQFLANLEDSLRKHPRAVYLLYHNPLLEHLVRESRALRKIGESPPYSMFAGAGSEFARSGVEGPSATP
jgi:SAM-dependent methyltransferase